MTEDIWDAVDSFLADLLVPDSENPRAVLQASADAGLPSIAVSAEQGKLLYLLAKVAGARRVLEIGTLGGYSAIWLARALPAGGRLITLEADPRHAEVARANLAAAGVGELVEVRVGRALDTLPALETGEPFDLIFIDADKASYPDYLGWAMRLSRPGTMIIADNVVRGGAVISADSADANVQGIRRFLKLLAAEPRADATAIQTVGSKGYDGFAIALVRDG